MGCSWFTTLERHFGSSELELVLDGASVGRDEACGGGSEPGTWVESEVSWVEGHDGSGASSGAEFSGELDELAVQERVLWCDGAGTR